MSGSSIGPINHVEAAFGLAQIKSAVSKVDSSKGSGVVLE